MGNSQLSIHTGKGDVYAKILNSLSGFKECIVVENWTEFAYGLVNNLDLLYKEDRKLLVCNQIRSFQIHFYNEKS